jgi:hypothetical protein
MELREKDLDIKIKDHSSIKYHKEMNGTWFSLDFIVFSLWPYY